MIRYRLVVLCSIAAFTLVGQITPGDWYGTLDAMGQQLPLVIHLQDSAGYWTGTMDSPKQKAYGIEMNKVEVNGMNLVFSIDKLNASYQGSLSDSLGIGGTFKQGAFKAHLSFSQREVEVTESRKKQDPSEPYPYLQEEVEVLNVEGGFTLRGTLTHPDGASTIKIPCIILITGSGPQDRNEEILGHRPFLVLADQLTRAGYCVLRLDDRGAGKSEGTFTGATSVDFAQDISAALEFAKGISYIDNQRIILMGHSEGGMIANMVAVNHPEVFGVISLAGPGVLGATLLMEQQELIAKSLGATKNELKEMRAFSADFFPLLTMDSLTIVAKKTEAFLRNYVRRSKEFKRSSKDEQETWITQNMDAYVNPWMIYFLNYNPEIDLKKITCHYLALNGSTDLQVPSSMNLNAINANCNPGEGKVKKIIELQGLNHLFQPSATGSPTEYGSNEITFDESAIKEILAFIEEITH